MQVLILAQMLGFLSLVNISLDGNKVHADASKSKAVSYKRLLELEAQLRAEVNELFAFAEQADQSAAPARMVIPDEISQREMHLARLAEAKAVLEARAKERDALEQGVYDAMLRAREEKAARTGRRPGGRAPTPPTQGVRDTDQDNGSDPESRIMKNPTNAGMEQHYSGQVAVEQESLLIVGCALANHPTDQHEEGPTLDAIPAEVGMPEGAALDTGYFSAATIAACAQRGIEPNIAIGRPAHHQGWQAYFAAQPAPPPADASSREQMAHKLRTEVGRAIYRRRKCTVEPVIGGLKEVLGFRQFSLQGLEVTIGEWCLLCLARNLKRLHVLRLAQQALLPALAALTVLRSSTASLCVLGPLWSTIGWIAEAAAHRLQRVIRVGSAASYPVLLLPRVFSPTRC